MIVRVGAGKFILRWEEEAEQTDSFSFIQQSACS